MRLRPLIASAVLCVVLTPAVPAFADGPVPVPSGDKLEEGLAVDTGKVRAIVELANAGEKAPVAAQATSESLDVVLKPDTQPFVVVEGSAEELAALAKDPRVTSIHRDRAFPPAAVSNLQLIGADQAHAKGFQGTGQVVAVLDTGIDTDHPYLQNRVVGEACFSAADQGAESLCPNGQTSEFGPRAADSMTAKCLADGVNLCEHGTHVAGIAAGSGGVAPGAGIYAVQVFSRVNDPDICGEPSCILAFESSLRLALDHVSSVIGTLPIAAVNMSLGGQLSESACDDDVFKPKIDELLAKGVATVVAAGNESFEGASFPGCISSAVTVGAASGDDTIADFSNRGALLDLFAPGVDVESSVPDNQMAVHSGTSMAAPHVAGAIALLKAASPQTPMTQLIDKLKQYGRPYVYQANGAEVRTPRLDLMAAINGSGTQAPITQNPTAPPSPDPSGSGPTPAPTSQPSQPSQPDKPAPIPLPTVTVTVTVTVAPAAPVCTRGTAVSRMTVAQWAVEMHRNSGTIPDSTLTCYLGLVQKASAVFPELTRASSLGKAYRVLKSPKTDRDRLDSALLAGWLNWAHGVNGTTSLKAAEKLRLSPRSTPTALQKAAATLK